MEKILTDNVLKSILKGSLPTPSQSDLAENEKQSEPEILTFDSEVATNPGDNYLSVIYSVNIYLEEKENSEVLQNGNAEPDREVEVSLKVLPVIFKTVPRDNPLRLEMVNECGVFRKEVAVYEKVLPFLEKVQLEKGLKGPEVFSAWPKCFSTHLDGIGDYLALENLKTDGYKMLDRKSFLDFQHCALVLKHLARFHAISFAKFQGNRQAILDTFPELHPFTMFSSSGSKSSQMRQEFLGFGFNSQADFLKSLGHHISASRMAKLAQVDYVQVMRKFMEGEMFQDEGYPAVIIHGDCWTSNLMFRYEQTGTGSVPKEVKFLDFQISAVGSRFLDISYFLLTSAKLEVLQKRMADLLLYYYGEFNLFVEILGGNLNSNRILSETRSFDWFLREENHFRFYGVVASLLLNPWITAESSELLDMNRLTDKDYENSNGNGKGESETKTGPNAVELRFYKEMINETTVERANYILMNFCKGLGEIETHL